MMLVIYGPTTTGKTDLAIKIAKKYNGEIISADSRQVYKGLDIGTGKVSRKSKVEKEKGYWIVDGIKINGFDLAKAGDTLTVADFLKETSASLFRISEAKKIPIVVGGTGFYIKALIDGIETIGIPINLKLRQKLEKLSANQLYKKLKNTDELRASLMNQSDSANPRRLIRAIEVAMYKKHQILSIKHKTNTKYLIIGLTAPNEFLYNKADKWLKERLAIGLLEEVEGLIKSKIDKNWLENLGLEYRWITKYITGKLNKETVLIRLKGDIHSFIRRQKTWFNKFKNIELFDISKPVYKKQLEKKIDLWYTQKNER